MRELGRLSHVAYYRFVNLSFGKPDVKHVMAPDLCTSNDVAPALSLAASISAALLFRLSLFRVLGPAAG